MKASIYQKLLEAFSLIDQAVLKSGYIGQLGDVAVWNKSLTEKELFSLYHGDEWARIY